MKMVKSWNGIYAQINVDYVLHVSTIDKLLIVHNISINMSVKHTIIISLTKRLKSEI